MPVAFDDKNEQELLSLAIASYYGLWIPHLAEAGRAPSEGIIAAALATVEPLGGRWKLAWGPVSLRSTFGLLDDVLAFVARHRGDPERYAVVLRGTNPLSLTDWIFGDGWVRFDEEWESEGQPERISRSTGLGLAVVRNLRAVPASGGGDRGLLGSLMGHLTGLGERLERRAENVAEAVDAGFRAAVLGDEGAFDDAVYAHTIKGLELRGEEAGHGALTLAEFLRRAGRETAGRLEVQVTGHSKGAALATAVAMWLEDHRRDWDPAAKATVRCTTFAGPTAGNAAFAARVSRVLGDRHRRVANRHDLVTEGWSFTALDRATSLYGDGLPPGFMALVRKMAEDVRPLNYAQVDDPDGSFEGGDGGRSGGAFGQMIHQHMNAYILNAGLPLEAFDFLKVLRAQYG